MRHGLWIGACVLTSVWACGNIDNPFDPRDDGKKDPPPQACDPLPDNGTAEKAQPVILGEEAVGRFCKRSGVTPWFKNTNPSLFHDGTRFRLKVKWDRGTEANDLDFAVGRLNGDGTNITAGTVVSGSCTQPAGQDENCVTEVAAAESDGGFVEVYVRVAGRIPESTQEEVFRITLTEESPPMQ